MTPFNLEQALAGKPFTNDKGWTVEDWHYFKSNAPCSIVIKWKEIGGIHGYIQSELFMLPEKRKVWIVVYKRADGGIGCILCNSEEDKASTITSIGRTSYLETIEKEYEL